MAVDLGAIADRRAATPDAVATAYSGRMRRPWVEPGDHLMIIAADHPARGSLGAGKHGAAMGDRAELLGRLQVALDRPGVDGVLAAPDVIEDLLLLGALEGKLVVGSMNRGGLPGASFEVDDRFTAYDAAHVGDYGLDAGKMLLRIDPDDPRAVATIERCAEAVTTLADRRVVAMVEPFMSTRRDSRLVNHLGAADVQRSATIAAGLGSTSAYTWLKLPVTDDRAEFETVAASTALPIVLLGGEVSEDPDAVYAQWQQALQLPTVRGLTVGRSLLFPPDGDVAAAVDTAVSLLPNVAQPSH